MAQTTYTVKLPRPHAKQSEILRNRARFRVAAIGRQFGKTTLAVIACVNRALAGQRIWYGTPTYRLAKQVYGEMKMLLRTVRVIQTNDSDLVLRFPSGGFVKFVSLLEPANLRGEHLDFVVIDEAAHVSEVAWTMVLRPMLLTTRGEALFISSPNGVNWFRDLYLHGLDDTFPDYASWQLPSSASPYVPADEIESLRRNTPERAFRQEYLAEFLEDGGAVFRNFRNCLDDGTEPRYDYLIAGVDLGRVNDFTVITLIDPITRRVVHIERFTDTAWMVQTQRVKTLAKRYPVRAWVIEENFNDKFVEDLQLNGLPVTPFRTTATSKAQLISALAVAFEQQQIVLPHNELLLAELQAYTITRTASGHLQYSAPSGLHDDMVMSLALAWHGATQIGYTARSYDGSVFSAREW